MRQTPVNDYLEEVSTRLPEELYGNLSDAIYETVCEFDEEVAQLKAENAKLRELVRMMWKPFCWAQSGYDVCLTDEQDKAIRDMVRELGVEVDE